MRESIALGIKKGMAAFVITYLAAFIISLIFSITGMDLFKEAVLGAMGAESSSGFGAIIKMTAIISSVALFNIHKGMQLGILILGLIPLFAFFITRSNKASEESLGIKQLVQYFIGALVFSLEMFLLQAATQGEFMGVEVSFMGWRNPLITFFVAFAVQMIIGINSKKEQKSFIRAAKLLIRMAAGVGASMALYDLIRLSMKLPLGVFGKIGAIFVALPNAAAYKMFLLMGIELQLSDSLVGIFEKLGGIGFSYQSLSVGLSVALIFVWLIMVAIAISRIQREGYWLDLLRFIVVFTVFSMFLAFCGTINIGKIAVAGEISIGISVLQAVIIPFVMLLSVGIVVWLFRKMLMLIKEIN